MSSVLTKAFQYSDSKNEHIRHAAFEGFVEGYHECMAESPDMDEWQQRLSDDYSRIKVKFWDIKVKVTRIEQLLKDVRNGKIKPEEIPVDAFQKLRSSKLMKV